MENECLAKVEKSMEIMAPRIERIEIKLDHLIEKSSFRWGMVIGVSGFVSLVVGVLAEVLQKL